MLDLLTGGNGTLAIIGAALVGFVAVLWRVFHAGRQVEQGKAAIRDNKGWVETNDLIEEARTARRDADRNADAGGLYDDDGHKRPKS